MNIPDLTTFTVVATHGTMTEAARRLDVPKSTISRRIQRLEDELGVELFRRTARSIKLSEAGLDLLHRTKPLLDRLEMTIEGFSAPDDEPSGVLRVTTTPSFGQSERLVRCLRDYALRFPQTRVELEVSNRLSSLVEDGFDVALRLHIGPLSGDPSLRARRLMRFERGLYASPQYLVECGAPAQLDDLAGHRLVAHAIVDRRVIEWHHRSGRSHERPPFEDPRWVVDDTAAQTQFALSGAGIALVSSIEVERYVRAGALVRVLPEWSQQVGSVSMVWPESRHLSPRVQSFIEHAVESLGRDVPV